MQLYPIFLRLLHAEIAASFEYKEFCASGRLRKTGTVVLGRTERAAVESAPPLNARPIYFPAPESYGCNSSSIGPTVKRNSSRATARRLLIGWENDNEL